MTSQGSKRWVANIIIERYRLERENGGASPWSLRSVQLPVIIRLQRQRCLKRLGPFRNHPELLNNFYSSDVMSLAPKKQRQGRRGR